MLDMLLNMDPLTVALGILGLLFLLKLVYTPRNSPPGPIGYPVLGNVPLLLSGNKTATFRKLRREYGDVVGLRLGCTNTVVVNGYDTLKEAFVKHGDVLSDRPNDIVFRHLSDYGKGIVGSTGDFWKHTRTFSLGALREFGFGKRSLESKIQEEVSVFLDIVADKNGEPFFLGAIAQISISNIICSIAFGERYDHDDKEFKNLLHMLDKAFFLTAKATIVNFFPFLRFLPGDMTYFKAMKTNLGNIRAYLQKQIDQHRDTFDEENIRDFIDAFLKEELSQGTSEVLHDENLKVVLGNLYIAGTETTATTIKWAILFLIHNPEVQTKVRQEIENVIGCSRIPSMNDKPEMVYTEAFIHETLRMGNIAPLALQHAVKHDCTLKGYTLRKGDVLLPNLDSVMFDESLFEDPHTFYPDRFIGDDGKLNGTERHVLAFSLGRRVCFGESLARMELFLFLTTLIQRFNLLPEDEQNLPTLEPIVTITNSPQNYKFKAVKLK
ncbi:cytochrome P450 2C23-like [Mizuhopecten yessoensis]|uniref:Cytochrome P450 2J2 n=1 Tax=Mizuhopecten yessoensis TaxID=6573 RepID=A0A210QAS1_MIZYE|nr:cytochrome P450 2C23-like [Mizuhopecten yessoensis]OWF45795.1 Cytochrome P450 2J2 [Mizuhopecten yessoensis]